MEAGHESQLTPQSHLRERAAEHASGARATLPVVLALVAGLVLRLWMLRSQFEVNGDSLIYGGLAKNLLLYGRFDLTLPSGEMYPTLIRLPGYPIFLAVCFRLFGMENYYSAACVQIGLDLLGCLLLAGFVRRIAPAAMSRSAALATLWLAALCPFTASYTAEPMTETATLFVLALAMWAMARFRDEPKWANALWFTAAVTCATLLRPDGALAAIAFAPALVIGLPRGNTPGEIPLRNFFPGLGVGLGETGISARKLTRMAAACVLLALTPFAVWTARNWSVFHVFEPLAPRLATDPGESSNPGWERWIKSWCLDFISTYEIYWNVPGDKLDVSELPSRAFDSPAQYAETAALAADYNTHGMDFTPEIDAGFDRLAGERIAADPLRSYVWLPLGRVADMWLRPRVENLNIDLDWWVYSHHHAETEFSWAYAELNAAYLILGIAGLCLRPRFWAALVAYMLLRSALLLTVEAPETRYTLECFPMLIAGSGIALAWLVRRVYLASKLKAPLGSG
jgi:Dolichyl-phosphate-mannose-protein mannosyltransferase